MREGGEKGFVIRQGYSPEVTSEIAIRLMESVLLDADYFILRTYEADRRAQDGADLLFRGIERAQQQATQQGARFELRNEYLAPFGGSDNLLRQPDWSSLPEPIKEAWENIRRRGLLEFMREEGYKLKDRNGKVIKQVLGQKIPPLVQAEYVEEDRTGLKIVSW